MTGRRQNDAYTTIKGAIMAPISFDVGATGAPTVSLAPLPVTVTRSGVGVYDFEFGAELPPVDQIVVHSFNTEHEAVEWTRQTDTSIRVTHSSELGSGEYASFLVILPQHGRITQIDDGARSSIAIGDMAYTCLSSLIKNGTFTPFRVEYSSGAALLSSTRGMSMTVDGDDLVFDVGRYPQGAAIGAFRSDEGDVSGVASSGPDGTFTLTVETTTTATVVDGWFFSQTSN